MAQKILFVITKSNWGGAQRYVFDLATSLPSADFNVKVIFGGSGLLAQKLYKANIETISFEKLWRDVNFIEDLKTFFKLISVFKKERADIVHLNSSKIGAIGALAARLAGVEKIFFTVHGFAFNEDRPWVQKKIIAFISWLTLFFCTDIIFISQKEFDYASKWPWVKNKLHVVYNGIAQPNFLPRDVAQKEIAQIIGVTAGNFVRKLMICTIAELTQNKGLYFAIEALKDIPNAFYIIMGTGELKRSLIDLIHKHGLEDRVFLAGFIPDAAQFLKAFDVFLLPSLKEGMPYVLLEAGYAQLAVVSSNVGGIPEIVHASKGILVPSQNAKAISKAFDSIENEKNRQGLASAYHEYIIKKCSLDTMLKEMLKLYTIDKNK